MTSLVVKIRTGRKITMSAPWSMITQEASRSATARGGSSKRTDGSRGSSSTPVVFAMALTRASSVRSAGRRCGHGTLRCRRHRPVDAVVPLLRQRRERAVGVHVIDDLADSLAQALRVAGVVLVERDRQRLVIERIADQLDLAAVIDVGLDRLLGADRRVAADPIAERQVVQGIRVGLVGLQVRAVDLE